MAITITASELAEAIGGEDSPTIVARVLATASAIVTNYAPAAPDAVQNEAVVRFAGYLFGSDFGGVQSESIGPMRVDYATNHAAAFRYSGAAGLLTRYKRRRTGSIDGTQPKPAERRIPPGYDLFLWGPGQGQ